MCCLERSGTVRRPVPGSALRGMLFAAALVSISAPTASSAQDKDQVRDQAKALEAQLRAAGEPKDRCSLRANIHDGPIVIRTSPGSALIPGDRLVLLNGTEVSGKPADTVITMLRSLPPDATIAATVDRGGELVDVSAQCINSRLHYEPMMNAISFAAKGKFDDCVETISRVPDGDTQTAIVKSQCAAASRKAKNYNVPAMLADAIRMAIDDAQHAPVMRAETVRLMRNFEGPITSGLGKAGFQALVDRTKTWPGGENLFGASAPDWAMFRRNSERALRSRLIDPESARIEWTHGFTLGTWKPFLAKRIEGYWSCGLVNARNRMGGYTGSTAFVVVLDPAGNVIFSSIGESSEYDMLTASCNNSLKLLPPPPPELQGNLSDKPSSSPAAPSLADELQKLVDLRNSGALTEAEFQAAKQRLLGMPPVE